MNRFKILASKTKVSAEEVIKLFLECGWGQRYAIQSTKEIFQNDSLVIFAKDKNDKLVGLLRIAKDGGSGTNVIDLVIHPRYQTNLISAKLISAVKKQFGGKKIYIQELNEYDNHFFINRGFKLRKNVSQNLNLPIFAKIFNY